MLSFTRFSLLACLLVAMLPLRVSAQAQKSAETYIGELMDTQLKGFVFNKRIAVGDDAYHVLLFERGEDILIVCWTTAEPLSVGIPASNTAFDVYNEVGAQLGELQVADQVIYLDVVQTPRFYVPRGTNNLLRVAVAASTLPAITKVKGPDTVTIGVMYSNVLNEDFLLSLEDGLKMHALKPGQRYIIEKDVQVGRQSELLEVSVGAYGYEQKTKIEITNPIYLSLTPDVKGALNLVLRNPSGNPFEAQAELRLLLTDQPMEPLKFDVAMRGGQKSLDFQIPRASNEQIPYPLQVVLIGTETVETEDKQKAKRRFVLAESLATLFRPAGNFTGIDADGKPAAYQAMATKGATLSLTATAPLEGLPNIDAGGIELLYNFSQAGGNVGVVPRGDAQRLIPGRPTMLGIWVYGDGSGKIPSLVVRDVQGKRFAFQGPPITWKSWEYVKFKLNQPMAPPLTLETFFRLENDAYPSYGRIFLNDATWIYEEPYEAFVE